MPPPPCFRLRPGRARGRPVPRLLGPAPGPGVGAAADQFYSLSSRVSLTTQGRELGRPMAAASHERSACGHRGLAPSLARCLVPASSRPRPGLVPASSRPRSGLVPASSRPRSGLVPASFRPRSGLVPASSRPPCQARLVPRLARAVRMLAQRPRPSPVAGWEGRRGARFHLRRAQSVPHRSLSATYSEPPIEIKALSLSRCPGHLERQSSLGGLGRDIIQLRKTS